MIVAKFIVPDAYQSMGCLSTLRLDTCKGFSYFSFYPRHSMPRRIIYVRHAFSVIAMACTFSHESCLQILSGHPLPQPPSFIIIYSTVTIQRRWRLHSYPRLCKDFATKYQLTKICWQDVNMFLWDMLRYWASSILGVLLCLRYQSYPGVWNSGVSRTRPTRHPNRSLY